MGMMAHVVHEAGVEVVLVEELGSPKVVDMDIGNLVVLVGFIVDVSIEVIDHTDGKDDDPMPLVRLGVLVVACDVFVDACPCEVEDLQTKFFLDLPLATLLDGFADVMEATGKTPAVASRANLGTAMEQERTTLTVDDDDLDCGAGHCFGGLFPILVLHILFVGSCLISWLPS
jgi:hypothetical protein